MADQDINYILSTKGFENCFPISHKAKKYRKKN